MDPSQQIYHAIDSYIVAQNSKNLYIKRNVAINNQMQTQTTQHKTLKPQAKFHNEQQNSYATLQKIGSNHLIPI